MKQESKGDFRETLYTIDKKGNRHWVYPTLIRGFWWRNRAIVIYALMAFYLVMPWIKIAGEQAILLDIPGRRFTVFGATFWATDTSYLVMLLGGLAISLFFFTAMFGRIWCGWACPQTVFLEFLFRPVERLIEGNSVERERLDKRGWDLNKTLKKGAKIFIFALLSWIIASTFLAYFVGAERLIGMIGSNPLLNPFPFGVTLFVVGLTFFQFSWFREQFCTVLCPYARFQSVMMDSDSISVGYDKVRGEPRAKLKDSSGTAKGDCIDCGLCVRVCPTGIDIRNGLQLECIACASCIDACDSVMLKIGKPAGLIRYDTENKLLGLPARWLRPRVLIYSAILVIYVTLFVYRLSQRELSEVEILRASHDLPFNELAGTQISNHLEIKISNKSRHKLEYNIELLEPVGAKLVVPVNPYPVEAESLASIPVFINLERQLIKSGRKKARLLVSSGKFKKELEINLIGPG